MKTFREFFEDIDPNDGLAGGVQAGSSDNIESALKYVAKKHREELDKFLKSLNDHELNAILSGSKHSEEDGPISPEEADDQDEVHPHAPDGSQGISGEEN